MDREDWKSFSRSVRVNRRATQEIVAKIRADKDFVIPCRVRFDVIDRLVNPPLAQFNYALNDETKSVYCNIEGAL